MAFNTRSVTRKTDDEQPLNVLQITDTHLFADTSRALMGVNTEVTFRDILSRVNQEHGQFDLTLATGDIVHDGSNHAYQRFRAALNDAKLDAAILPGNHDDAPTLYNTLAEGQNSCTPSILCGQWHFIMLNSAVPGQVHGHLEQDQFELLGQALDAFPDKHTVVCVHHQPVNIHSEWLDNIGIDNGAQLMRRIQDCPQVKALIWGHIHQEFEDAVGHVQLFASPSTCIQFAKKQDHFGLDALPPGFRIFKLYADGTLKSTVHRLDTLPEGIEFSSLGYK